MTPRKRTVRTARALLLENVHAAAREVLGGDGVRIEALPDALGETDLAARLADVDLLGIRSKTRVTKAALARAPRLLAVGCFCIGTDQVDLPAANRAGVPVFNAPFSNTRSVAEMVIGLVIALSRKLGDRSADLHAGRWRKAAQGCHEVRGRTIGIVGYGHIGSQVGVLAEAIGMRVVYHDIVRKLPMGNNAPVATLAELLAQSDFVTLHVPETPLTMGMIGQAEIARMRPGSALLNTSRGSVVKIPALARALRAGRIAGAAVDVHPVEPEANGEGFASELQGLPNVILTPHVGGSTEEAQEAIGREVAGNLVRFLKEGATSHAVNFPRAELPPTPGAHRILNVHRNVPGVLRDVNRIVSDAHANIEGQVLATDPHIGYLIMDVGKDVSEAVRARIDALPTNIRTRILY